jgi:hypothetical protein
VDGTCARPCRCADGAGPEHVRRRLRDILDPRAK